MTNRLDELRRKSMQSKDDALRAARAVIAEYAEHEMGRVSKAALAELLEDIDEALAFDPASPLDERLAALGEGVALLLGETRPTSSARRGELTRARDRIRDVFAQNKRPAEAGPRKA